MGPKHKSRFKINTVINNSFTIIEETRLEGTSKGKGYWMYICRCNCGNLFKDRQHNISKRLGCISCTASKKLTERYLKNNGMEQSGIKGRKYREYKAGAEKRNLSFNLSLEQFLQISSENCYYCGQEPIVYSGDVQYMNPNLEHWKRNGIDRLDTTRGYELDNCVPCCSKCNYAKHSMTVEEFKEWITKIYNYMISSSTTIPNGSTAQANGAGNNEYP